MKNIARFRLFLLIIWIVCAFWPGNGIAAGRVQAALLVNLGTGKILYERNANLPLAPASLTKIMTMFLTMDAVKAKKISLKSKIKIPRQAAATGGSRMGLKTGERIPIVRLLTGTAVSSGNDAATALALAVSGSTRSFVRAMNAKARSLGMRKTHFKNPTGLPAAGQKTTASDLYKLCAAYLRGHPDAARFHNTKFFMHQGRAAVNTNPLLGVVPGVDGLKTGWTVASGYNLIITARRGKTRLLAIVLGGSSKGARDYMARRMIEAGFRYPANVSQVRNYIAPGRKGSSKPESAPPARKKNARR